VAFNCNIDLIEAVIKNQIKDDSKASHWRRKVRDFATKVNTGLLKNFNTGLTMAQELRLFIAA
jgi:glycosyltransferase involved in cell wall biosynthesis